MTGAIIANQFKLFPQKDKCEAVFRKVFSGKRTEKNSSEPAIDIAAVDKIIGQLE